MVLFNYVKYRLHKLGFYFYSVKYSYEDKKGLFYSVISSLKLFFRKSGYYEYIEIPITTRCSLRCKNCSNIIPYYKCRNDFDINILIRSIKMYLKCIERIVYVRVLGGEPFLSDNLKPVLLQLIKSDKIQRIEIVTNGTVVFNDSKLIKMLKNRRIVVCISKYSFVDSSKLIRLLKDNNIKYRIDNMKYWMDYGEPIKRDKDEKELKRQFFKCSHIICVVSIHIEITFTDTANRFEPCNILWFYKLFICNHIFVIYRHCFKLTTRS